MLGILCCCCKEIQKDIVCRYFSDTFVICNTIIIGLLIVSFAIAFMYIVKKLIEKEEFERYSK